MGNKKKIAKCIECGQMKPIQGRAMCGMDYERARRSGQLDRYKKVYVGHNWEDVVEELEHFHFTMDTGHATIQKALGVSNRTYMDYLKRYNSEHERQIPFMEETFL